MPRIVLFPCLIVLLTLAVMAQQPTEPSPTQQPQVKVNMLNVCTPSGEEQKEIASALARVPKQPLFGTDFEVSRGRSTLTDMPSFLTVGNASHVAGEPPIANYVRIRREFSVQALFSSVQYSFSNDGQTMVETMVLHVRDPKDLIEVSLENSASAVASSEAMLGARAAVGRVRLERFGKSSVALVRCQGSDAGPAPDQSAYEPLFRNASEVMSDYRTLLNVRTIVPEELAKINGARKPHPVSKLKSAKPPAKSGSGPR